jgi:lysylphosphatidylglycerol synthetase-like protein (DUF2156 family)
MTDQDKLARDRYFTMRAIELLAVAGAVFGLVLMGRAIGTVPRVLGAAIVLSSLLMIAVVPRAMAKRWRTPVDKNRAE